MAKLDSSWFRYLPRKYEKPMYSVEKVEFFERGLGVWKTNPRIRQAYINTKYMSTVVCSCNVLKTGSHLPNDESGMELIGFFFRHVFVSERLYSRRKISSY